MSVQNVSVDALTADQALIIYRNLGPDLRLLVPTPFDIMPIGWAFEPENANLLLRCVQTFLRRASIRVVKLGENHLDFSDPSEELSSLEFEHDPESDEDTVSFTRTIFPSSH